jgi:hypothetical protein
VGGAVDDAPPPSLVLICVVEVSKVVIGGGASGLQTHVGHDETDVVEEDDWEITAELDIDIEERENESGSVDVETSCCCNEVVTEEALRRARLVPAPASVKNISIHQKAALHWVSTYPMVQHWQRNIGWQPTTEEASSKA